MYTHNPLIPFIPLYPAQARSWLKMFGRDYRRLLKQVDVPEAIRKGSGHLVYASFCASAGLPSPAAPCYVRDRAYGAWLRNWQELFHLAAFGNPLPVTNVEGLVLTGNLYQYIDPKELEKDVPGYAEQRELLQSVCSETPRILHEPRFLSGGAEIVYAYVTGRPVTIVDDLDVIERAVALLDTYERSRPPLPLCRPTFIAKHDYMAASLTALRTEPDA
jgi:hypothetical protein